MKIGFSVVPMVFCAVVGADAARAADVYVQGSIGNDANPGDAWGAGHALASIQQALNLAAGTAGADIIHVAAGTYAEHLLVGNDVTLLGSYPADGNGPRDRIATPSIVDGSGNGVAIDLSNADHVQVDRFVVTNGHNEVAGNAIGGGVSILYSGQVSLTNNLIENSFATWGGGVGVLSASGTVTLTGNLIRNNQGSHGGGLSIFSSTAVLTHNTLTGNSAVEQGGGLLAGTASLSVTRNTIRHNQARNGGGVSWEDCVALWAADNTIASNQATYDGGGIYHQGCDGRLVRNIIQHNRAGNWGGGVCILYDAHPELLVNNLITGNRAGVNGGGVSLYSLSSAVLRNNTLARNRAAGLGGGLHVDTGTSATVKNSILWANRALAVPEGGNTQITDGGTTRVTYSDVAGGWAGIGNINATPGFQLVDDYHLLTTSPAIEHGTVIGAPLQDLDGNPRPTGPGVDMGAYEWTAAPDLTGYWSWQRTSADGLTVTAAIRVKNRIADQNADRFSVDLYLSDDGEQPVGEPFATYLLPSGLAGGAAQTLALTHTFPASVSGRSLLAMIDSRRQVVELNERNNMVVRPVAAP